MTYGNPSAENKSCLRKKVAVIFLAVSMLALGMPQAVRADSVAFAYSGPGTVTPDSDIVIPVNLIDATDVTLVDFVISYDPAMVSFVNATEGDLLMQGGCMAMAFLADDMSGTVTIDIARLPNEDGSCGDGVNGTGLAATVTFHANSLEGDTELAFASADVCHPDYSCDGGIDTADPITITVAAPDVTPPVITVLGDNPMDVETGDSYADAGATALDDTDGDLTADIVAVNPVDTDVLGAYTVTYNVSDSAGNPAVGQARTVNVIDTTAPIITLIGSSTIDLVMGDGYTEPGAEVTDNYDTGLIAVIGGDTVDTNATGTYMILYDATDSSGNHAAQLSRTVNVADLPDTAPPARSAGSPSGALSSGTAETTISVATDEDAVCRYSAQAGTAFGDMAGIMATSTDDRAHSATVSGLADGSSYAYYIRCADASGNANTDDYALNFSVANPAPAGGGGAASGGGGGYVPPAPAQTPPQNSTAYDAGLSAIKITRSGEEAAIAWKNPDDNNFGKAAIVRLTEPVEDYLEYAAVKAMGETIYEGAAESYTDTGLAPNLTYYYAFFAANKNGGYSDAVIMQSGGASNPAGNDNTHPAVSAGSLAGMNSAEANAISGAEAKKIYGYNRKVNLGPTENRLYLFITTKSPHALDEQEKYALAYFIQNGSETTVALGAGERAGVLNSYLSAFDKLPGNEAEWQDVVKIANGRWPDEHDAEGEVKAENDWFVKIYKRKADMSDPNDNAAVTVICYGLRPRTRNIDSERAAIKIFSAIFGAAPVSAADWDIVRAIAYSGAKR